MAPFTPTTVRAFSDPDRTKSIEYALTVLDDQCKAFSLEAVSALVASHDPELWASYDPSLADWAQGQLPGADLSEAELRLDWPKDSPTAVLWVHFQAPAAWLKTIDVTCIDYASSPHEDDWWPVDQAPEDRFNNPTEVCNLRYILITKDEWPDEWS
jgi:hypothetical protein